MPRLCEKEKYLKALAKKYLKTHFWSHCLPCNIQRQCQNLFFIFQVTLIAVKYLKALGKKIIFLNISGHTLS
jgi:hypothetical protein